MSSVEGVPYGQGVFPLSAAQLNIYFAQKLAPHVPFTIAQYVEIRGHIDPATLIRATDIACRELETPLVRLGEKDGHPYQWYDDHVPYAMIHRDLREQNDPVAVAQQYMNEQYRQPVDLVRDQLVASEIIQVGDEHFYWYSRAHHVVMDGLGAISVQERTAAVYTALLTGSEVPKTKAVGVRDIYDYEAAYPGSSRYESDREYWTSRLATSHLAGDAGRLAGNADTPSGTSVSVGAVLDSDITAAMAEVARRYNSSDVPVVLAAFALYLARMTDADTGDDVMLSLPVSGRATTRLRSSSGMMSNIVPLRVGVDSDATVEELLRRIQVELTGALRHQRFRVEDMQRESGVSASTAAGRGAFGPTVNIMMYDSTIRLGDVVGEYRVLSSGPIDDMMVNVYPGVAGASTRVDFLGNPALYNTDDLAAHHERFLDLLRTVVAAEDGTRLGDIDVARDAGLEFEPPAVASLTLSELVHPDAVIRYEGNDYPVSPGMAASLAAGGVGPEVRVAVALKRSHLSVLTVLGISAAGGSFVPVDPGEPSARLDSMLDGVALGIAEKSAIAGLPSHVEWLAVEDLALDLAADGGWRPTPVHLDNEAYVIHTSGSTGKPKAVSITHRGLAGLAAAVVDRYSITSSSRVLHLASPVFDASIQEMLGAFAAGATLVVAPSNVYAGPALADLIAGENVTHLITSPTVLGTLDPSDLAGVEVFDVGGEACPPSVRDRFAGSEMLQATRMLNAYGPTETTVLATVSAPMQPGGRVDIGAPLPGVTAAVLDARLRNVPRGGVGELYLGGDGVARGYSGQPGLTSAMFVAGSSGSRLYRTGDVVRRILDGFLEYIGRADQQVQLHGRRVELGEIDSAGASFAGGSGFVVAVRDDRLVGYTTGSSVGLDEHLRRLLPTWMVPERIVELDALPMTPSGKVDRRALPAPDTTSDVGYVAPVGDTEAAVAAVFADVLGVAEVGRQHSFFALGGDSLSATRVVARLGSAVSLPVLFDAPTVAELAAHISEAVEQPRSLKLLDTVVPEHIPLSYAQQRMWFLNQFDAASPAYNMPVALRLEQESDPDLVVAALRDVLERHESLRTYFPDDEHGPRQAVVPTDAVLPNISRSTVVDSELDTVIAGLAATGFDVAVEVPIRAAVLTVEPSGSTVVVIVLHHICIDGWSIDPLVRDFTVAHLARTAGHAPTWPRLAAQYSQYAVWNRAVVDSVAGDQLSYWTAVLQSDAPLAELPVDHSRPPVQSMVTARVPVDIGAEMHDRMTELARAANATTFMVVHAALAATLSRFGTSSWSVIGSPSAGRGHEALDEMVGMFVGTVPLAVDVDLGARFTDLLTSVRRADLDAFANSELPFERIVDALATDRSLDRHPLFQVMLAYDNAAHQSVDGLPVTVLPVETNTSEFDLNFVLTETSDGIDGQVEYAVDLYDRDTVERFADAFVTLLRAVVDDPSSVVGDIPLAALSEPADVASAGTLLDVFMPGDLAIDGDVAVTYQELELRSNRLARLFIANGAGPEVTVALSLERSAEYIVALWAVAKSGAAFVPVDPHYPALRRRQMLAGTTLGIGGDEEGVTWLHEADALPHSDAPVTDADRLASLRPEHPAYVIHTSGSTGTPKPVTVTHSSVHLLAQQVVPRYAVQSDSRVLHGYSVNFDAAVLELVLAFGAGATMVIAPTSLVDGDDIAAFLEEHAVTHYLSTPAVLATVPPVPSVTTVAVGGDVLGGDVVEQWSPGRRMLNAYGPSEATVVATLTDPLSAGRPTIGRPTIGRPLDHVGAHVLDARLRPVPVGGVGELYLGGAGVARGYSGQPVSTAERFVAAAGGRRVYRTGDLVRLGASGELDFRGRMDSQVQIRGVRIELGDVRASLLTHPDVRDAVVDVREGRLLAWAAGGDERELREWLLERMPLSMVPSNIVVVDRIPVTTNGKVDIAALEETVHAGAAARTLAEDVVVGIFTDVLGAEASADTNFFVHGGDSLTATRAVARVGAALSVQVPVRTLFEAPTPRELAAAIETLTDSEVLPPLVHRPEARERTDVSPAERRIWLQNRFDPESAAYNIAFALPLRAESDTDVVRADVVRADVVRADVVRAAIADVIDRHLPLRTIYRSSADGPVATLLDADAVVSSLDERHTFASPSTGFDLAVEPPVRLSIVDGSELLVVAHHIAVDGLSMAPLARDVKTALTARRAGLAPEFTPLAVDYADYRMWQREVLAAAAPAQLDFWRRTLAGMPDYLDLPHGTPTPDEASVPVTFEIDADTLTELRGVAHRLGATVFVLVHAALAAVLAEASGTTDIAIGTPVSGRTDPALDDLVGMFVGTVVLRTPVDPSLTFEEFVADVLSRDLDAFAHAAVPFEWVVDAVHPTRAVDSHPLFQVLLAVGAVEYPEFDLGAGTASARRIDIDENQFDLEVVVDENPDGLSGVVSYSATRFERAVCVGFAERLAEVLRLVATSPTVELGSREFLGGDSTVRRDGVEEQYTLRDLVEHAAEHFGSRSAVLDGDTELTYRELDERSDALLQRLIDNGAGPGTLVGVALPRSAELVTALWAVAKSGAGYLPIDPAQPPGRIDDIIAHARPVTVIDSIDSYARPTGPMGSASVHLGDIAYVIYTSGSTGVPKGVRVTHRGIADLVQSQRELFGVGPGSRVLQFASPAFDASLFEMLLALGAGASLVVAPPDVYAGRELEAFIDRNAVTHVCLTPTVLQITDPSATRSVDVVIMAGEAVNSELMQRWSAHCQVFNAYGPTETTIMGTCTTRHGDAVTIGGPVSGFDALVLDSRLRPVPDNVVGELYLGGPGLAEGYLGQPGLTASRFVPDADTGTRLYRTGDLVRWHDRELEFLGRVDSQVKIRGHRVELAEVEAELLRGSDTHRAGGVEQACVVGRDGTLDAYVVGDVDPRAVRERLTRTIPAFMVPTTVTRVDALPVSISGKVDVSRLPAPALPSTTPEAPSTPMELTVRATFATVLELQDDRIGVDDNFFDLGGHSLSVVQVMDALGDRLGRTLPIGWLLQFPTVRSLAAQVDSGSFSESGVFDVLLPLRTTGSGAPLFCVHPAIGIAWSYYSLLADTDRPVYGLQVPGIAGDEAMPDSIDELAVRYVREIRSVQPQGPYHLIGWSLGGVIAHSVATRLQAEGDDVAQLVLVDTHMTAGDDPEFTVDDLARQLGVDATSFEGIATELRSGGNELAFLTVDHLRRMFEPVTAAPRWVGEHAPRVFDGDVVYLAAGASVAPEEWERYIGGHISVRRVEAAHEDMLGKAGAREIGRVVGHHSITEGVA